MTRRAEVFVNCDTCGRKSPHPDTTIKRARALAKPLGWVRTGDTDTCPDCRPGARKDRELGYFRDLVVALMRNAFNLNYRQIGMVTGLSRQRIHQICQDETTPKMNDWINKTKEHFSAEITVPRFEEPEEAADGDHDR